MKTVKVACVVGARPNFIKMASLIKEVGRRARFRANLIHTGQHYSHEMSEAFFRDLDLPEPDLNLGVGGGTQAEQTAEVMRRLEPVLLNSGPDLVLVVGDVNSTMATALVAAKLGIQLAHVEAGLRSFDRTMPEEINRLVTDTLSDYLFVTEPSGEKNLLAEGRPQERIFLVGNVMIDTLLSFREKAAQSPILERLGLSAGNYAVTTLHRPSNVDDPEQLGRLLTMLSRLAEHLPVVFPVHPRTQQRAEEAGLRADGVSLIAPQGYLDFLRLLSQARMVLTDSGGIQEETTILGVPCLTLRDNTERPVTIECGTNRLVGTDAEKAFDAALAVLHGQPKPFRVPALWDGKASERIFDILERFF